MDSPFLGQIQPFGFSFPPSGWALCQGQIIAISTNAALYSLLGVMYGGNGQTTFALPDLRGRSLVGMGQGPGLTNIVQGEMAGTETVTLLSSNMPMHTHTATATSTLYAEGLPGTSTNPAGKMLGGITNGYINQDPAQDKALDPAAVQTSVTIGIAGGNLPFSIRDPFLGINYSIALEGIFPSRN